MDQYLKREDHINFLIIISCSTIQNDDVTNVDVKSESVFFKAKSRRFWQGKTETR